MVISKAHLQARLAKIMVRMKPQTVGFDGFLFDLDGTLIDSTKAVVRHWHKYANIPLRKDNRHHLYFYSLYFLSIDLNKL